MKKKPVSSNSTVMFKQKKFPVFLPCDFKSGIKCSQIWTKVSPLASGRAEAKGLQTSKKALEILFNRKKAALAGPYLWKLILVRVTFKGLLEHASIRPSLMCSEMYTERTAASLILRCGQRGQRRGAEAWVPQRSQKCVQNKKQTAMW